jgi:predicted O-methyltransferase YrrM
MAFPSLEHLAESIWDLGRLDGSYITSLRLLASGEMVGSLSDNEAYWKIDDQTLIFFDSNRQPSTHFTSCTHDGEQWSFVGKFKDDVTYHTLIQRTHTPTMSSKQIDDFESLYDYSTGGWMFPSAEVFNFGLINNYKQTFSKQYGLYYGPVELEVAHFYYWIVQFVKPKVVLETGTNLGYSTSMIASAMWNYCRDGSITTIDLQNLFHLWENQPFASLIRYVQGNSLQVDIEETITFDLLVLDSDHSYDTLMGEVLRFEPKLKVGGFMLLHDSMYFDGVGLVVEQLHENPRFDVITLPTPRNHGDLTSSRCPGMSLVRKLSDDPAAALKLRPENLGVNVLSEGGNMQISYLDSKRLKR